MSAVRSKQRLFVALAVGAVVILGLAYLAWFTLLNLGSEEGDVPSASSMQFPDGTAIVRAEKECGSGGCWSTFTVRPADGSTPADFEGYLAKQFDGEVPGTFFDPRAINYLTAVTGSQVVVTASYWSSY